MAHERREADLLAPGTIIIAKLGSFPHWPGFIGVNTRTKLSVLQPTRGKDRVYWVYFYNSYTGDWIPRKDIEPYNPGTITRYILSNIRIGVVDLQGALDEANDRLDEHLPEETLEAKVGDVVLAKFEGFPNWPGIITASDHTYERAMRGKWKMGGEIHVMFLPDSKENWVSIKDIRKYTMDNAARTTVRRNNVLFKLYQEALNDANSRKRDFDSRVLPPWVDKKEDEVVTLTNTEKADILG